MNENEGKIKLGQDKKEDGSRIGMCLIIEE